MKAICYQLLTGQLTVSPTKGVSNNMLTNNLPITVDVRSVPYPDGTFPRCSGDIQGYSRLAPNGTLSLDTVGGGGGSAGYWVATMPGTGGLIDVYEAPVGGVGDLSLSMSAPNDIGPIPVPTAAKPTPVDPPPPFPDPNSTIFIPPDSPRVLIGCGVAPNGNPIVREQYWKRHADSICLAAGESRQVSYTVTSGREETSSDEESVAASLGASASAGWGPFSASISAALSTNSTHFQQVTVTSQSTSYVSSTIQNQFKEPVAFIRWQLVDVITVFDKTGILPIASIEQAQNPVLVMGPYWITKTPEPDDQQHLEAKRAGVFAYSTGGCPGASKTGG